MAASGIVNNVTFTPTVSGKLSVSVSYDCQVSAGGSDWASSGNAGFAKLYTTQSGTTTYGPERTFSTTRQRHALDWTFDVVAGAAVDVGLFARCTGLCSINFWNIDLKVEFIKR